MTPVKPQFLRIRNWERFQHYTNRRPPWIKYHVALLDDHALLSLDPMAQLVYDRLLLRAALTDNNIEHDSEWLGQKFNLPAADIQAAIESLVKTGFLRVVGSKRSASTAIAKRKQPASPRALVRDRSTEAETKTEPDASERVHAKSDRVCQECGVGGGLHVADCPTVARSAA